MFESLGKCINSKWKERLNIMQVLTGMTVYISPCIMYPQCGSKSCKLVVSWSFVQSWRTLHWVSMTEIEHGTWLASAVSSLSFESVLREWKSNQTDLYQRSKALVYNLWHLSCVLLWFLLLSSYLQFYDLMLLERTR